jgi:hypothetical protein
MRIHQNIPMPDIATLVSVWDTAIWEFSLVFEGLEDADVWRRPDPKILSIGEIAGHVAYWEAMKSVEPSPDNVNELPIKSPLLHQGVRYFTGNVSNPVDLGLSAEVVKSELERIHAEVKDSVLQLGHKPEDLVAGTEGATWGFYFEYFGFHVAYHAGQAFSARHLMGHETTDN